MIFDRLSLIHKYTNGFPNFNVVANFLKSENKKSDYFSFSKVNITSEIFVVKHTFTSKQVSNNEPIKLESHRKYIDVHVPLSHPEKILFASTNLRQTKRYNSKEDVEFFHSATLSSLVVDPQQFIVFFPGEAHSPGHAIDVARELTKLVFKIKMS